MTSVRGTKVASRGVPDVDPDADAYTRPWSATSDQQKKGSGFPERTRFDNSTPTDLNATTTSRQSLTWTSWSTLSFLPSLVKQSGGSAPLKLGSRRTLGLARVGRRRRLNAQTP